MDGLVVGDLLLKFIAVWFAVDVLIWATIWYATATLQYQFPHWWKTTICDYAPTTDLFD